MSNINKESIEKVFNKHFDSLEDKIDDISQLTKNSDIDNYIKFYSNGFDNTISTTNQSPKLEPIKEAIKRKFNLNIKPSFFGVPKDSSKYAELLYEYNKEVTKERNYLKRLFGNDYEKILDKIVDEKYKRTQDYWSSE